MTFLAAKLRQPRLSSNIYSSTTKLHTTTLLSQSSTVAHANLCRSEIAHVRLPALHIRAHHASPQWTWLCKSVHVQTLCVTLLRIPNISYGR